MAFDKSLPKGTDKIRDSDDMIRANNAALEDAIGQEHYFITGGDQTGYHKFPFGTTAERPAAGHAGRIYLNTETLQVERDTGSDWVANTGGTATTATTADYATNAGHADTADYADNSGKLGGYSPETSSGYANAVPISNSAGNLNNWVSANYSPNQTGYVNLLGTGSSNIKIQWGTYSFSPADANSVKTTVSFGQTFPNACFNVMVTPSSRVTSSGSLPVPMADTVSTSGFTLHLESNNTDVNFSETQTGYWVAIGW